MVDKSPHYFWVPRLVLIGLVTIAMLGPAAVSHAQRVAATNTKRVYEAQRVTVDMDNAPLLTVLRTIATQAGLVPWFNTRMVSSQTRITLHVRGVTVAEAFARALQGTGLMANVYGEGDVAIVRVPEMAVSIGTITGRVTDATTRQPLRGARIGLDGDERVTETADDGRYRLAAVSPGLHTVTAKLLGYAKGARPVTVPENGTATADIPLGPAATPLGQVIVTGTIAATPLKAVPAAMTVITAREIEQRGVTHIDQLFRGEIPGLFVQNSGSSNALDQVTMYSRGATKIPSNVDVANNRAPTNAIKTYVDGIELADPSYLSQIDPASIERIEILTGPQASTIYGSNALNGVMQIFTKRSVSSHPRLTLTALSGLMQNNFSSALTPFHDDAVLANGTEGRVSYNAGGSWNYVGAWTPAKMTTRTSGFGGARMQFGTVTVDPSARIATTVNRSRGDVNESLNVLRSSGVWTPIAGTGRAVPQTTSLDGETIGITLQYAPVSWWSHQLVAGSDKSDTQLLATDARYTIGGGDSLLSFNDTHNVRTSWQYTTTASVPVTPGMHATMILGTDAWHNLVTAMNAAPTKLTGTLTGTPELSRQPGRNAGGFVQGQLGLWDALFLTYGLRAEWNPTYGANAQPNLAPRYGLAYTRDMGQVTAKLRASYGRSTRPPDAGQKLRIVETDANRMAYYGPFARQVESPDLAPEFQRGGEGGIELYVGTRASFILTHYDQTVAGLINPVPVDSVRSLAPGPPISSSLYVDPAGYKFLYINEYLNIGNLRNRGWELQSAVSAGPVTTKGTYSFTKSRVIGISPAYRTALTGSQYQPGAIFNLFPEHTWSLQMTYGQAGTMLALSVDGTGFLYRASDDLVLMTGALRLSSSRLRMGLPTGYRAIGRGYTIADFDASHRVSAMIDGVLHVHNLTNFYQNDVAAIAATLGRQTSAGARIHL